MQQLASRPWIIAGVALAGAGVIAVTPVAVSLSGAPVVDVQLTAGGEEITLDFVRHGQSQDNVDRILGTTAPGAPLTDLGEQQAHDVAPIIQAEFPNGIDDIYASNLLRAQETAAPLAQLLNMPTQLNPGLNEVNAGSLEGNQLNLFTDIGYLLPQVMWILGLRFVPMLGSTVDPNGMAFEDRVNDAVQTIYDNTVANQGPPTDVAFAEAGLIDDWTLMTVKNPDFGLILTELLDIHQPLPNVGQVVIQGSPEDGWTLVSWNGTDVPPEPGLLTSLFVDLRSVIAVPQMALWHLWEAIVGADSTTVTDPMPTGFDDVLTGITGALNDGS